MQNITSKEDQNSQLHFIIGFPRSGTKLLRELLKTKDQIDVNSFESNFLIHKKIKREYFNIIEIDGLINLIKAQTIIVNNPALKEDLQNFKKKLKEDSFPIRIESIYHKIFNPYGVEIFLDKSPRYSTRVDQLSRIFPESKYIFICRDVRDVVLSTSKTWGKSYYRTADQWDKTIFNVLNTQSYKNNKVLIVKYEDLLDNAQFEIKKVLKFLGKNSNQISSLQIERAESKESYGEAANMRGIKKNNKEKFYSIKPKELTKIEKISFRSMSLLGYKIVYAQEHVPLKRTSRIFFKIQDELNLILFHIKDKGPWKGIRYYIKLKNIFQ